MNAKEIAKILHGFFLIIKLDNRFVKFFDNNEKYFWKSFYAALIVAPLQVFYEWGVYIKLDEKPPLIRIIPIETLEYIILWFFFPLVMTHIIKAINREEKYFNYIITYNWFQMGLSITIMPFRILSVFNLIPLTIGTLFETIIFIAYIFYNVFIAREILRLTNGPSFSIILINILLTLLITQIILSML